MNIINLTKKEYKDYLNTLDDKQKVDEINKLDSQLKTLRFDFNIIKSHLFLDLFNPMINYIDKKITKEKFKELISNASLDIEISEDILNPHYYQKGEHILPFSNDYSNHPKEVIDALLYDHYYDEIDEQFINLQLIYLEYKSISHYLKYKYCDEQKYKRSSSRFELRNSLNDLDENSILIKIIKDTLFLTDK